MGTCQSQTPPSVQRGQELLIPSTIKTPRTPKTPSKPPEVLDLKQSLLMSETQEDSLLLKKISTISPKQIKSACYIPERNLFLALSDDSLTIYIYHTNTIKNFNLIAVRTSEMPLSTITYIKELNKILIGGCIVQIWSPKDLRIEAQTGQLSRFPEVFDIVFLPSSDMIVVKAGRSLLFYDRNLKILDDLKGPSSDKHPFSFKDEIFSISKDLLLVVSYTQSYPEQRLLLVNLKTRKFKKYHDIYIPKDSCVEMTQETPEKVFTCLTFSAQNGMFLARRLTQFTINPETQQLVILKKADMLLTSLFRIENTRYFLAEEYGPWRPTKTLMLFVSKDKVEVIRVLSRPGKLLEIFGDFTLIMLKNESLMVGINRKGMNFYSVYHKKPDIYQKLCREQR